MSLLYHPQVPLQLVPLLRSFLSIRILWEVWGFIYMKVLSLSAWWWGGW